MKQLKFNDQRSRRIIFRLPACGLEIDMEITYTYDPNTKTDPRDAGNLALKRLQAGIDLIGKTELPAYIEAVNRAWSAKS